MKLSKYIVGWMHLVVALSIIFFPHPLPEALADEKPQFKIGALLVLTGQFAMQGAAFREGIELAEAQINNAGGINGNKIKVVIEDTEGEPKGAQSSAKKLITIDKVNAALTMSYPDTKVGGGEFQKAGIPAIALWDSSPEIDDMGDSIFSLGPWAPSTGETGANFASKELGAKTAIIINTVEEWSEYVSDYFTKQFIANGGKILKRFPMNPEDSDFRAVLTSAKQRKPDIIFAPLTHNIVPFFRQKDTLSLSAKIVTGAIVTQEHVNKAPTSFEGVYRTEIRDPNSTVATSLFENYEKKYGKKVTLPWYVATGYDAVKLLAKVATEKSISPSDISKSLYLVKDYPGASKKISISANGSSPTFEEMYQIRNGKFVYLNG